MAVLAVLITVSIMLPGCNSAAIGEKPTIKISDLNWGSAHFQSEMAKIIIEKGYGYPAELVPGATIPLFQGLRTGDVDVFIEGWLQNQQEAYDAAMAAGEIELLGFINHDNWQSGFVVPTYVIKGDSARGIERHDVAWSGSDFERSTRSTKSCSPTRRTRAKALWSTDLPDGSAK